jgi:thiol-disulfide isomerase/thioredoxin
LDRALELEHQVRHLDSLPSSVDDEKLLAHAVLVDYYGTAGVSDLVRYHARRVLALAQNLSPDTRLELAPIIFGGYHALATMSAQRGDLGTAQLILANIPSDISTAPAVARSLGLIKGRYALIGKTAPSLDRASWINTATAPVMVPPAATGQSHHATVIEFTAWWCGPCHESYPYLRDLPTRFPGQSVSVVFITARMGRFRKEKALSREEEFALLADYFVKEEHIPFPVGVIDSTSAPMSKYYVEGVPELIVVDASGVVRAVMQGWDADVEQRMTSELDTLLK